MADCPVCGERSDALTVVHDGVRDPRPGYAPRVLRCGDCTTTFLWPRMADATNRDFYQNNAQLVQTLGADFDWQGYARRTRVDVLRRARFVARLLHPGDRLLEIGCGYGFFLAEINDRVAHAIGIEPGAARSAFAREQFGVDIRPPPLTAAGIAPSSIDIACAFHVLEHIDRPRPFLVDAFDILRPGGRLVIEVPNVADIYLRLSRPYRHFHFQTAHAVYFSPATLQKVLTAAGFAVESLKGVQRYAFDNALHWLARCRPQLERPSRRANSAIASLFDGLYRRCLETTRRSDTLICVARKPRQSMEPA